MLRFGLIGCGTHAQWAVAPALRGAAGRCELVAAADINPDNLQRIEGAHLQRFTDHRRMIADARLDAVYVATLPDTHAAITLDALAAGLHVVCEKPMALSAEDCRKMTEAAARGRRVLAINFETRYHAQMRQVRQWISQGHLGRIEAIHVQSFWDGHKSFGPLSARRKRLTDLSGALDCGIHKADLIRYFCGGSWTEIQARGRWFGEEVRCPPHIAILAELDNGVLATLNASFAYTAAIEPKALSDVMTIVGTEGVINFFEDHTGPAEVRLHSRNLLASIPSKATDHAQVMITLLCDFADAVEGRPPAPEMATGEDGLMAQIFVEQANRQALERRAGE